MGGPARAEPLPLADSVLLPRRPSSCPTGLIPGPLGRSAGSASVPAQAPSPPSSGAKIITWCVCRRYPRLCFCFSVQGPGASEGSSGRGKAKRNTLQMPRSQVGGRPCQVNRVRRVSVGFQPGLRCPLYKDLHLGLQHSAGHTGAGRGDACFLPLQLTWNPRGPPGSEQRPSGRRARWGFLTLLLLRCLFPDFRVSFSELRNQS